MVQFGFYAGCDWLKWYVFYQIRVKTVIKRFFFVWIYSKTKLTHIVLHLVPCWQSRFDLSEIIQERVSC